MSTMDNNLRRVTWRLAQWFILVGVAVELLSPASSFAIEGGWPYFCGSTITAGTVVWGNGNYNDTPPYVVGTCSPVNVYAQAALCSNSASLNNLSITVDSTSGGWYETITNYQQGVSSQQSQFVLHPPTDSSQLPCIYTITATATSANSTNLALATIVFSQDGGCSSCSSSGPGANPTL